MPQIVPMKELRTTSEISELAHAKREPIFVTKNGYGDLVVMSMETYESVLGTKDIDDAIADAETEIKKGAKPVNARAAFNDLREKYFG